ncbi:MAG TPA: MFS transporter [Streptosporangiaceae bacterium]|nr:MFS transporter [Streptosporangiaceae bacterium]
MESSPRTQDSLQARGTSPALVSQRWSPRLWAILIVLCGALFLDALDVSMVGVALPAIRSSLGLTTSSLQWIVSGYVLGYGGLLLLGGRAADLLGRRRVFLTALALFAVASLFGGLVSSPALLIGARFIKGMAAAVTAPAGLSLLTTTFHEGPMRNRAISVYSAFGASGFSLGLVLSGLLTEVSWRLTLLVPAPVALITLIAAIKLIPRGEPVDRRNRRFDLPGAVTVTAGMLLLVYTVVSAQQAGWASARTIGSFAAVALLLAAFWVIETRSRDPLVRLGVFRSGPLTRANIGAITLFGSYVAFQFLVTQYLQSLAGWSALSTAMAFLPAGVVVAILSTRMSAIIGRFGSAGVAAIAFGCLVAGYAVFLRVGPQPDYPTVILPAVLLIGMAFGLGFSALSLAATAGVADREQGLAASLFQTSFQVGGAVVLAVVTAVVNAGGANGTVSAQATLGAYRPALALITGVAAVGAIVALTGLRPARAQPRAAGRSQGPVPVPARIAAEPAVEDSAGVADVVAE